MSRRGPWSFMKHDHPHYVYRCYDSEGRLLYVGCAVNPIARVATHRSTAWWADQIATVRHTVFPTRRYALQMEWHAIVEEGPRWNIKSRWQHRSLWTADHYADYHQALVMGASDTPATHTHVAHVVAEAKRRYGINLEQVAA